ncbi:MAG: transglycosylase SLT domain-containing protein [Panacagrimonas sp.]
MDSRTRLGTRESPPPLLEPDRLRTSGYITAVAPKYELPIELVTAICQVESGCNRFAVRTEPAYPYLWDVIRHQPFRLSHLTASQRVPPDLFQAPPGSSRMTEWLGQQSSWGLMQVMGAVAREYGYKGHLPGLCDPLQGLHYGCKHLARLRDRFYNAHGWRGVAAAYNAGTPRVVGKDFENQAYVNKIDHEGGFVVMDKGLHKPLL